MKLNAVFVLIATAVIFFLGFFAGYKYQSTQKPPSFNILPIGCEYGGKSYKQDEGFKSTDGCNSCSCDNGQVACTEMACLPD